MSMEKRRLGNSELRVAPLAFGGNVFGWTADEPTSFKLLDAFVEAGLNLIDTADVYSRWVPGNEGGESEAVIGRWLQKSGKRDRVLIATKVGMEMAPDRKGLSRAHILRSVEASLRRLQTDTIDLYQAPTRRSKRRSKPSRSWSGRARCAPSARRTIRRSGWPRRSA